MIRPVAASRARANRPRHITRTKVNWLKGKEFTSPASFAPILLYSRAFHEPDGDRIQLQLKSYGEEISFQGLPAQAHINATVVIHAPRRRVKMPGSGRHYRLTLEENPA